MEFIAYADLAEAAAYGLLMLSRMANQTEWQHVDAPAETGPDYVALVIEWDDSENDVTQVIPRSPVAPSPDLKKLMMGAGALAALLVARWGVHRLRA